ncbi:PLP-dependent aminotransferase family protein [Devosia sp.]|uniref:MocR-like pyridoxine biosynthesis transcription factor PdxR n=1 Tax=Devosia sp. TaxID=1871048 RepID=UPI002732E1FB|nr:PLP-dependent aminotransferase family protein [Devosia sp.]MDP2781880.1 PLP-dependent aminotransferase family protein [Devosia sp.]
MSHLPPNQRRLTRRRESPSAGFQPRLDPAAPASLARQLYLVLREAMADGRIRPGQRLPSSRLAAQEWVLSRGTIAEAYDILIAEGYAIARHGSGTYVLTDTPAERLETGPRPIVGESSARRTISRSVTGMLSRGPSLEPQKLLPFVTGRMAHDERTASLLNRLAGRHMNYAFEGYGDIQGEPDLRAAIVAHVAASRGVRCTPEQLFITAGTQQALDLAFRVLVSPGDRVVVEDPCYPPARQCLALNGAEIVGLPVDQAGVVVEQLTAGDLPPPALIYVTPSNQYPSGSVLSLPRRLDLLAYARANGCWIVEDDYDSEFRYDGHAIASLQGLDQADRVLYTGTFSKALLPSLRLGYLVVPPDLVRVFRAVRPALDRCPPTFQQRVVADFLQEGYYPAHLRRLRERLRASRDMLAALLQERIGDHLRWSCPTKA